MSTAITASHLQRIPELLGQTVVVIGGSAGIGLETARRAHTEGAKLILTDGPGFCPRAPCAGRAFSLILEVARNAADKVRAGGTLIFMGGIGGRRRAIGLGIASAARENGPLT
jgi:NAD(P)-dependent dehydrogenase (short-subunit alcohol dehydrogenase family)